MLIFKYFHRLTASRNTKNEIYVIYLIITRKPASIIGILKSEDEVADHSLILQLTPGVSHCHVASPVRGVHIVEQAPSLKDRGRAEPIYRVYDLLYQPGKTHEGESKNTGSDKRYRCSLHP